MADPVGTLVDEDRPSPTVAPCPAGDDFRLARTHLSLKSPSFLISSPISWSTLITSANTTGGDWPVMAFLSTIPWWTRSEFSLNEDAVDDGSAGGGIAIESAISRADRRGAGGLSARKDEGACDFDIGETGGEPAPVTTTAGGAGEPPPVDWGIVSVEDAARSTSWAAETGACLGGVCPGWFTLTNESVFPGDTARWSLKVPFASDFRLNQSMTFLAGPVEPIVLFELTLPCGLGTRALTSVGRNTGLTAFVGVDGT